MDGGYRQSAGGTSLPGDREALLVQPRRHEVGADSDLSRRSAQFARCHAEVGGPVMSRQINHAFTLVELLVVLLVTLLLVGSAATFMRAVAGARDVVENRLSGEQEAQVALRVITNTLRNAYRPVSDNDSLFVGAIEQSEPIQIGRVKFRAIERRAIRQRQPESDVHEIEFFMREQNGRSILMRRTDPTRNPDPDGGGVVEPLAMDVVG